MEILSDIKCIIGHLVEFPITPNFIPSLPKEKTTTGWTVLMAMRWTSKHFLLGPEQTEETTETMQTNRPVHLYGWEESGIAELCF